MTDFTAPSNPLIHMYNTTSTTKQVLWRTLHIHMILSYITTTPHSGRSCQFQPKDIATQKARYNSWLMKSCLLPGSQAILVATYNNVHKYMIINWPNTQDPGKVIGTPFMKYAILQMAMRIRRLTFITFIQNHTTDTYHHSHQCFQAK